MRIVKIMQCTLRELDIESGGLRRGSRAVGHKAHSGRHQRLDVIIVRPESHSCAWLEHNEHLLRLRSYFRALGPQARISAIRIRP